MIQSKKIDRYNDDFALKFTNDSKFISVNNNLSEITSSQDWSISFYCLKEDNTTQVIIDTRNVADSVDGWEIAFIGDSILFVTGVGTNQTVYTFNQYSFVNNVFNHVVFNFDSSTSNLNLYVNGSFKQFININTSIIPSSVNLFKFGEFLLGSNIIPLKGLLRDFTTYDKQLSEDEISYIYKTGVPPVSAYSNIQHYYPLNEIPTETSGNYFMSDKAESFNSSATNSEVELIGWTGAELGIPTNTTATTYRDWTTKANYIPDVGYKLGLNFDSSKQQYLEVTGLEAFDITEGYSISIGWIRDDDTNTTDFETMFSNGVDGKFFGVGFTPNSKNMFVSPNIQSTVYIESGSVKNFNSNQLTTGIISSSVNLVDAYSSLKGGGQIFNKGEQTSIATNTTNDGFDVNNTNSFIGTFLPNNRHFNGKINYLTIYKGVLTKKEIKIMFNNGIYRSPYEVLEDTTKIILDVDFQNPFVDGTDIKFPDNSGNCEVIAKQNSGTDWSTLVGVQNSID